MVIYRDIYNLYGYKTYDFFFHSCPQVYWKLSFGL
jgi:hypothetical protein